MHRQFKSALIAILLDAAATVISYAVSNLGTTVIVMLYLLAVMAASYFLGFFAATLAAIGAFVAINYFFIAPRYTFEVANSESWAALLGFLLVSIVVASLVKRLQNQTKKAQKASRQDEFARLLAEKVAGIQDEIQLFKTACQLIHQSLGLPVGIALPDEHNGQFSITHQYPDGTVIFDHRAAKWCSQNAKVVGPGSGNWPEMGAWYIPCGRMPGDFPVFIVMNVTSKIYDEEIDHLRDLQDQISNNYQRLRNERYVKNAEQRVQEEVMQNALLASVSHDMRTPLTAILGATTTLLSQRAVLSADAQIRLLESVNSEVKHLVDTTENILSLSRLESIMKYGLPMDWQSLEEIIGAVFERYRTRNLQHELRSDVPQDLPLIKADAALLSQALANLIDNALAVHTENEPVLISVKNDVETISLCVLDRGAGFPEGFSVEDIRKFHRAGAKGKGVGLGLSIVKVIAQLHEAELCINRREGGGTNMEMIFPVRQFGVVND